VKHAARTAASLGLGDALAHLLAPRLVSIRSGPCGGTPPPRSHCTPRRRDRGDAAQRAACAGIRLPTARAPSPTSPW
jgi:hypothetical protein